MAGKSATASAQLPVTEAIVSPRPVSAFQRPRHPPDSITAPPGIILSATGRCRCPMYERNGAPLPASIARPADRWSTPAVGTEVRLEQAGHPAVGQQQQRAAHLHAPVRQRQAAHARRRPEATTGAGAHRGAGAHGRRGIGAGRRLVVGHPVERRVERAEHPPVESWFDLADLLAFEVRGRNAERRLDPGSHGGGADVVVSLVELQMAGALVARPAPSSASSGGHRS